MENKRIGEEKESLTEKIGVAIIGIILVFAGTTFYVHWLSMMDKPLPTRITLEKCCGGEFCTETYYTPEDNLCHMVFCEKLYGKNNSNCVYEGGK
ncbi:MAG: hypothetical protein ACTSPV_01130 [Candidatus Hodarchaeales archaeon]